MLTAVTTLCAVCVEPGQRYRDAEHHQVLVFQRGVAAWDNSTRARRQVDDKRRDVRGYTEQEKQQMLDKHNELRQNPHAPDMKFIYWDERLAAMAQSYSAECNFEHNPRRVDVNPEFQIIGENLYAGTGRYDPNYVVQAWYDEIVDYDYDTLTCKPNRACGHYTAIVWANTYAVGCGVTYCPVLRSVSFGHGYHVVCNYGPSGNYLGVHPYSKDGDPCTQCEKDAPYCVEGMCARYPMILGGSTRLFLKDKTERSSASSLSAWAPSNVFIVTVAMAVILKFSVMQFSIS